MNNATIESLDREGRGVSHIDGKAIFIEGALCGETVTYSVLRRKPSYEMGLTEQVLNASASRVTPQCRWFPRCGGCSLQHLDGRAQVAAKQRILEDAFWHISRLHPERMLPPIYGTSWHYRHRARLSVRLVPKKGGVLVGFHERKSSYVALMTSCEVLPKAISDQLPEIQALISNLSIRDRLPQIEVAVGEESTVLVLRILAPLSEEDELRVQHYSDISGFQIWLQTKGPDTAKAYWPLNPPPLQYLLPEFRVRIGFRPTDFTQVNHAVNRILVRRAMDLLAPSTGDRIGDFFCGLGNFTLPMARLGASVFGVEGNAQLVARAQSNAAENGLLCQFDTANLFEPDACLRTVAAMGDLTKVLIDPPREGAMELIKTLLPRQSIKRLVYVSCDPATLARDAGALSQSFTLESAGVINMFPQTSHVESIGLFVRR